MKKLTVSIMTILSIANAYGATHTKLEQEINQITQKIKQKRTEITRLQSQRRKLSTQLTAMKRKQATGSQSPLVTEYTNMKLEVQKAIDSNNYDQLWAANEKFNTYKAKLSRVRMTQSGKNVVLVGMAQLKNNIQQKFQEFEKAGLSSSPL